MRDSDCEVVDNKPKPKGDEEDSGKKALPRQNCEFCGKKFKSGKALGGHKKIHFEAHRNFKSKKATITTNNKANWNGNKFSSLMAPNRELRLSCYLCNKDFPSEKSLCGHMRTHPNRVWRGVHPPPTGTTQASPTCFSNFDSKVKINNDNYVSAIAAATASSDASRCLTISWKKTNKRSGSSVFDAKVVAAAKTLVCMSRSCEAIEGMITQLSTSTSYAASSCLVNLIAS
ncbi:hypothetical protein Lal_00048626 [Lupinus albus]|uniref:Putative transcription factor C2H2 family n=1 Tax=Lupinus albus TaxID=3870 RepID=A0A6A4P141_LUPAL|nr:putative transcription factor C2H2 family [Lupinus albus]KAF1864061.1 hypothetical protein Lal_00048626 [Lupinus albus]